MSHAHAIKADLSDSNVRLGTAGSKVQTVAGIVGIAGLVASAVIGFTGMFGTTHDFLMKSWLQNYLFVLSISLGAFFFVFIQFLTRAGWSTTVRRVAELVAGNLQWAWVGLLPLLALWLSGGGHDAGAAHAMHAPDVARVAEVSYVAESGAVAASAPAGGEAGDGHGHGHAGWGPGILFPWADMEAMLDHNQIGRAHV